MCIVAETSCVYGNEFLMCVAINSLSSSLLYEVDVYIISIEFIIIVLFKLMIVRTKGA